MYWLTKINILLIVIVGNMCGADHAVISYDQSKASTFKSLHGFPCLSLTKAGLSYEKLPQEKREIIRQEIMRTGDERILALFNVATLLPRELQVRVISELFPCGVKKEELSAKAADWVLQCKLNYDCGINLWFNDIQNFICAANVTENPRLRDIAQASSDYKRASEMNSLNEKITQHFSYMIQNSETINAKNVEELNFMLSHWSNICCHNNTFLEDSVKNDCAERMSNMTDQGDKINRSFKLLDLQKEFANQFLDEPLIDMLELCNVASNFSGAENISPKDRVRRFYKNFCSKKLEMSGPPCYSREQLAGMQSFQNKTDFFGKQCFRYKYREKLTFKNVRKNWGLFYPLCMVPFVSRLFSSGYGLWGLMHCLSFPAGCVFMNPKEARREFSRIQGRSEEIVGLGIGAALSMGIEQLMLYVFPSWGENPWVGMFSVTSLYGIFSCVLQKHMMSSSDAKTKYGSYSKISKILSNPNIEIE